MLGEKPSLLNFMSWDSLAQVPEQFQSQLTGKENLMSYHAEPHLCCTPAGCCEASGASVSSSPRPGVEAGDGGGALRERTCVEGAGVVGGTGALLSNEPVERCRQLGFF